MIRRAIGVLLVITVIALPQGIAHLVSAIRSDDQHRISVSLAEVAWGILLPSVGLLLLRTKKPRDVDEAKK